MSDATPYEIFTDRVKKVLITRLEPLSFDGLKEKLEEKGAEAVHPGLLEEVLIDLRISGDVVFTRGRPPRDISWRRR